MNPKEDLGHLELHRIIEQARSALERSARALAELGATPQACMEAVRRAEGDAAVEMVQRSVREKLRLVREEVERNSAQASPSKAVARYVAHRSPV